MAEALTSEPIPVVADADGVMRIRGTRVTVDTVLAAFDEGATAEEIVQRYPSVSLADVYQVVGYYLRHSCDMGTYLTGRRKKNLEIKASNESRWPPSGLRDRMLNRRKSSGSLAGGRELQ